MKYYMRFALSVCILLCYHISMSQPPSGPQAAYAAQLSTNGVYVSSDISAMTSSDVTRIAQFNFDKYRGYNTREKVKVKNGPTIELASIQERTAAGIAIDSATVARRRDIASQAYPHKILTVVEVGVGQPVRDDSKRELPTYTIQPASTH